MTERSGRANTQRLAVFYEHPEWFKPLFAELDRRGVAYDRLLAHEHRFDPTERECPYALVVNRMSPSAHTRGHARGAAGRGRGGGLADGVSGRGVPVEG